MKKKILLLLFCILSFNAIRAEVTWTLSNGTLTISGTDMPDYELLVGDIAPWYYQVNSIRRVVIKDGVTNIGANAFSTFVYLTTVTIPNSVTSIGERAFGGCGITSIRIPTSVTTIGDDAFYHCSSLTSVLMYNSVTSIGNCAFQKCSKLASIKIPNTVTSIGDEAFRDCKKLTSVKIPNSVTSIGYAAFSGCSSLISITCEASIPPSCDRRLVDKDIPVYVPANSVDAYKEADVWKDFHNIQAITSTDIKEMQVSNNKSVIYDMNGRKVDDKNGKSGVFIMNGKKMLIK